TGPARRCPIRPAASGDDHDRSGHVLVDAADVAVGPRLVVGDREGVALVELLALRGVERARVLDVVDRRVLVGPRDRGARLHDLLLRREGEVDDVDGRLTGQRRRFRARRRGLGRAVLRVALPPPPPPPPPPRLPPPRLSGGQGDRRGAHRLLHH